MLTGFLVSASIATPIVGKLGDLYGKGRVLTAVLVLFSAGAVINALAPSIEVVIAGRLLQGVAGGVFPLAFGIVRDTFPREQIAGGLAMISAIFGIGGGIGLPLQRRDRRQRRPAVAVLDQPDRAARRVRRPPADPAVAAGPEREGRLARRAACSPARWRASCSASRRAREWGWGSPANVGAIAGGLALHRACSSPSRAASTSR